MHHVYVAVEGPYTRIMAKDLYTVLGVARGATEKELRNAYRKLARKHHPDVNPNDKAAESRFKEVNAAFEVLSDPDKRQKYDKYGERWEYADQIEDAQRRQGAGSWARGGAGEGGDFGGIFENLFRGGGERGRPMVRRGGDVEAPADLSLEEAHSGATRPVRLEHERRIEVKIPAGVKTGSRIRVAGEGSPGFGGGPNGDLFLVINVLPHARFERKGDDLLLEIAVPYTEAVLGGEVEVPTLEGKVALRVPELTQNGRQFRLTGKGMSVLGKPGQRGDLFARVKVSLPEKLTDEERGYFEELRRLSQPVAAP